MNVANIVSVDAGLKRHTVTRGALPPCDSIFLRKSNEDFI
jgi:hypothetical protein